MTPAVVALFAEGPTTIRTLYSWRLKKTERMKAIVTECSKFDATVEELEDYCIIHPPAKLNNNVLVGIVPTGLTNAHLIGVIGTSIWFDAEAFFIH